MKVMHGNMHHTEGDVPGKIEVDVNVPWIYRWPKLMHYYGDTVRKLLVSAAVLMVVGAPFYTDELSVQLPFIVVSSLILVCVAALTSPTRAAFVSLDTVVAGVGFVIFEMWALLGYPGDSVAQFALRQAIAMLFLFALYFSAKTLRNMLTNTMGAEVASEADRQKFLNLTPDRIVHTEGKEIEWRSEAREELNKHNDQMKREYDGE
jgi:hypothetical protein